MVAATQDANVTTKVKLPRIGANARDFFWHLLQMVIAMWVGMGLYHFLMATALAGTGLADLTKENSLFGYWMMTAGMVLGMLALMRYRRSTWRYCAEMTTAMLVPLTLLTILVLCYLIPIEILHGLGDPLMILAMAIYMHHYPHDRGHGAHYPSAHQHAIT